jgi:hypothetical protein
MKNINEVLEAACKVFTDLREGTLSGKEAKEMNNALGKVIAVVNTKIKYGTKGNQVAKIAFMEVEE